MARIRVANGIQNPFQTNQNHLQGYMIAPGVVMVGKTKYLVDRAFYTDEMVHLFLKQDFFETDSSYKERLQKEKNIKKEKKEEQTKEKEKKQTKRI